MAASRNRISYIGYSTSPLHNILPLPLAGPRSRTSTIPDCPLSPGAAQWARVDGPPSPIPTPLANRAPGNANYTTPLGTADSLLRPNRAPAPGSRPSCFPRESHWNPPIALFTHITVFFADDRHLRWWMSSERDVVCRLHERGLVERTRRWFGRSGLRMLVPLPRGACLLVRKFRDVRCQRRTAVRGYGL